MGTGNIKKFELRLGRTGLIIVVVGMAVLFCASFLFGVSVGKNIDTHPQKISSFPQRVISFFWRPAKVAVAPSQINQNEAAADADADAKNIDLTFHNALTQSKTPSMQPSIEEKKPDVSVTVHPAAPEPELAPEPEPEPVAVQKADAEKPRADIEAAKDAKKKQEAAKPSPAGAFVVHVASLKEKSKAWQLVKTLADLGYMAKVVRVDLKKKGIWYRVIIPGFETRSKAKTAVNKISSKVKTDCVIREAGRDGL